MRSADINYVINYFLNVFYSYKLSFKCFYEYKLFSEILKLPKMWYYLNKKLIETWNYLKCEIKLLLIYLRHNNLYKEIYI